MCRAPLKPRRKPQAILLVCACLPVHVECEVSSYGACLIKRDRVRAMDVSTGLGRLNGP